MKQLENLYLRFWRELFLTFFLHGSIQVLPLPEDLVPAQKMAFTRDSTKLICASTQNSLQVCVASCLGTSSQMDPL